MISLLLICLNIKDTNDQFVALIKLLLEILENKLVYMYVCLVYSSKLS